MAGTPPEVYDGLIAILPLGRAGQVAWENRLLQSPFELLDAKGVTFEDRHVRKEAGISNFDPNGVAVAAGYSGGSTSTACIGAFVLASFPGNGAGTPAQVGTAAANAGANVGGLSTSVPAAGWSVGDTVMVCFNLTDFGASPGTTLVTDSKGNTYTKIADVTTIFCHTALYASKLTTALIASDTIDLDFAGAPDCTVAIAGFSNLTEAVENTATRTRAVDTAITVGPLASSTTVPLLLVASLGALQTGTATFTPGGGWTEAIETSSASGDFPTDCALHFRVDTSSPIIIAIHDWYSGLRIASGGTFKATTTQGSSTVTGTGGTLWTSGTEAQRIFPGDQLIVYDGSNIERRTVLAVASDTSLTTTEPWVTSFTAQDYVVVRGSRLLTATTGGNIFKERSGDLDAVTLKAGLSKTARPGKFIVAGKEDGNLIRKVLYINGSDRPQLLSDDGATTTNFTTENPDWDSTATNAGARPANGVVHRDRVVLIVPRGKDPHRLYLSSPTNHTDFGTTNGTTRRVRSDIGDELWGLASFQGVLWCWKYPVGIFYIDDSDLDPLNWIERTKSQAVGCAPSPYAVCPMDDDVIFMSATGAFHLLSAVDTLGGVRASDISWRLGLNKWLRDNLNLGRLGQTLSVWYPDKKVALFSVPAVGSTVNNLMLKWDFSGVGDEEPPKFGYSFRDTPDALALKRDTDGIWKPVIGEGVFVKLLERTARNKEGLAYTGAVQTPHLNFAHLEPSLEFRRKLYEHLELVLAPVSAGTLTVEVYVDGVLRETLTYDATRQRQRRLLRVGDGHTISVKVTNSVLDEDFKVLAALVYFQPGNNDQSR